MCLPVYIYIYILYIYIYTYIFIKLTNFHFSFLNSLKITASNMGYCMITSLSKFIDHFIETL